MRFSNFQDFLFGFFSQFVRGRGQAWGVHRRGEDRLQGRDGQAGMKARLGPSGSEYDMMKYSKYDIKTLRKRCHPSLYGMKEYD